MARGRDGRGVVGGGGLGYWCVLSLSLFRSEKLVTMLCGTECTDAIDNIGTKVDLLKYCVQHNIQIFSSMGAGAKSDPTRIQIADISETLYDPLARSVRQRLRASGIVSGVPVVYSTEVPGEVGLLPLKEEEFEKGKVGELAAIDEFRVRILPVLGASLLSLSLSLSRSYYTSGSVC